MIILGIETSCDETAVGIVDARRNILANCVYSQQAEHLIHGGVVPEIAARAHVTVLDNLIKQALQDADLDLTQIDGFAATCGPGLIGGVMVGMMTGKALSAATHKPFLAVNHLEAHILTPRLTNTVPFPYLVMLISGGHTQLLLARHLGVYDLLGESIDDAAGEAFDKSAKLMGLPYPGGPQIEKLATSCPDITSARARFPLPLPLHGKSGCNFSFSGLKTAMRTTIANLPAGPIDNATLFDLCAALQSAIGDTLCDRLKNALPIATQAGAQHMVLAGGVAANTYLRTRLINTIKPHGLELVAPPVKLCTDNGVMIAWTGLEHLQAGHTSPLDTPARPRWPLTELKEAS
jgi:N6-L-threonylcarbamoyladenine synthase